MTRIELSDKFKNQIKKVKDESVMDSTKKEFKALLKDPTLGKYRLIYALEDDVVRVYSFEHRRGLQTVVGNVSV